MIYRITHQTHYRYQDDVTLCHNQACLLPRTTEHQVCRRARLSVEPLPVQLHQRTDFFGNTLHYFAIQAPHSELVVTARSEIELQHPGVIPLPRNSPPWEEVLAFLETDTSADGLEARGYVLPSPYITPFAELTAYTRESFPPGRPILDAARELTQRIFTDFTYDPNFTTLVTPLQDAFKHRRGVCQDFAHLAIAGLRGLGLAARYVSGYIETLPPPGQEKLQGSDASHAWLGVFVPRQGWTDFDPTNNQITAEQHITTAWGRDYHDVTPLKGVIFGGGGHTLSVSVDVERILG